MSVVLAAEILPMALFGIPSGSVVARLGARTTMLVSDLVRAPLVALVPILHWTGHLSFPGLLAIVFLLGCFNAPYISSQRSILPEIFGDDENAVSKASGLFGAAQHLPIVIGPSIAGVLIGFVGTSPLLVVDAGTFLFAFVVVLGFVRGGRRVAMDEESRGVLAGVRYLMRDKLLGPMTLTVIVLDGAANGISVAVPLLAFTRYDENPHIAGWIFTAFGVGAIMGSVLVMKLLDRVPALRLACIGIVAASLPLLDRRRTCALAGRRPRRRAVRALRPADQRAGDGAHLDPAACGAAREGDDRRHGGERARRPSRPARDRSALPARRERGGVARDRRRDERRGAAVHRRRGCGHHPVTRRTSPP